MAGKHIAVKKYVVRLSAGERQCRFCNIGSTSSRDLHAALRRRGAQLSGQCLALYIERLIARFLQYYQCHRAEGDSAGD